MYCPLISVIIPLYNVNPIYFDRCLHSIIDQSYKNFEIVVVDDGSGAENAEKYASIIKKYNGVSIIHIHQRNAGVSVARNKGIEIANGRYIAFVDGDDVVVDSFLYEASKLASENFDIIMGSMCYIDAETNERIDECIVYSPTTLKKDNILQLQLALVKGKASFKYRSNRLFGSPCARLYKTDICRKVKFAEGVTNLEDQLFNREYFRHINNACLVPNIWYNYFQYNKSAMHYTKTADNFYNNMRPFWNGWHKLNLSETNYLKGATYDYTLGLFNSAVEHMITSRDYTECKETIDRILQVDLFKNVCNEVSINELISIKHKATYLFIKHRLYHFIILYMRVK